MIVARNAELCANPLDEPLPAQLPIQLRRLSLPQRRGMHFSGSVAVRGRVILRCWLLRLGLTRSPGKQDSVGAGALSDEGELLRAWLYLRQSWLGEGVSGLRRASGHAAETRG